MSEEQTTRDEQDKRAAKIIQDVDTVLAALLRQVVNCPIIIGTSAPTLIDLTNATESLARTRGLLVAQQTK